MGRRVRKFRKIGNKMRKYCPCLNPIRNEPCVAECSCTRKYDSPRLDLCQEYRGTRARRFVQIARPSVRYYGSYRVTHTRNALLVLFYRCRYGLDQITYSSRIVRRFGREQLRRIDIYQN